VKLEDAQIGMKVIYTPHKGCKPEQLEEGVVTSKNDKFVFVRYGADYCSKATCPDDNKPLHSMER
jgi:hypothetical protein